MSHLAGFSSLLREPPATLWFGLRRFFGIDKKISSSNEIHTGRFYRVIYRSGCRRHEVVVQARSEPYLYENRINNKSAYLVFDWKKFYVDRVACYSFNTSNFGSIRLLGLASHDSYRVDKYQLNEVFVTKLPPWFSPENNRAIS